MLLTESALTKGHKEGYKEGYKYDQLDPGLLALIESKTEQSNGGIEL